MNRHLSTVPASGARIIARVGAILALIFWLSPKVIRAQNCEVPFTIDLPQCGMLPYCACLLDQSSGYYFCAPGENCDDPCTVEEFCTE